MCYVHNVHCFIIEVHLSECNVIMCYAHNVHISWLELFNKKKMTDICKKIQIYNVYNNIFIHTLDASHVFS